MIEGENMSSKTQDDWDSYIKETLLNVVYLSKSLEESYLKGKSTNEIVRQLKHHIDVLAGERNDPNSLINKSVG